MAAGRQRPQIATAHYGTADVTVTATYTASATEAIVVDLEGTQRYNDLSGNASTDLLAFVISELNASSAHTWAGDDPVVGDATPGRTRITCTPSTGALATLTIPSALGVLLGFDTVTPTVASNVVTSKYTRAGLWIPGPAEEVYVLDHHGEAQDNGVLTMGVAGPLDSAIYGRAVQHQLLVSRFAAPFAFDDYAAQAAFVAFDPALTAGDPNLSWESLCYYWARNPGIKARLFPDHTDHATYWQVRPDAWVYRPAEVLAQSGSRARLRYDLTCSMWEV